METARHRSIERLVMARPGVSVADASVGLWLRLAAGLVLLIGDGGFLPLYRRSVQLSAASFPWLQPVSGEALLASDDTRFAGLKRSFDAQDADQASQASAFLLNTFIDMLARLIGETLTIEILRSAWADTPFDLIDKELLS